MKQSVQFVPVEKAGELLGKSGHSVRQLIGREQLKARKEGFRTMVDLNDLLGYYARKTGFASWEANLDKAEKGVFVSLEYAAQGLMVQPNYIRKLIKDKTIEGYITASGDIMVSRDSINAYLRKPDAELTAKDL
jgi:hypothetical protein